MRIIDLRPSMIYRKGHIPGAIWSIRPRIASSCTTMRPARGSRRRRAGGSGLAARDLGEAGAKDIHVFSGGFEAWTAAGLPSVATADTPSDGDCIDFLFFTAARHEGDAAAARKYLTWETGLLDQLDDQERGVFRISAIP